MVTREGSSNELAELALAALHASLGARLVEERGMAVPGDYGDPAAELASMRSDYSVVDLSWLGRLELRGRDRHRFLNGLVTINAKDLEAGRGVYGFLLTREGRVLADVYLTALEDRLWLELPAGSTQSVRRHLESYRVIDDVEVASLDDMVLIGVLGPGAAAPLGGPAAALAPDATARARLDGTEVQVVRRRVFGVEGFVAWTPASLAADVFATLAQARDDLTRPQRARRAAGLEALEALRVEAGVPRFGIDYAEDAVANETGLVEDAIDFTKGCYLGQEIVARIHYRGKPSRTCVPVEVTSRGPAPRPPLSITTAGEREGTVGALTSAAPGRTSGVWLGIAMLERRALDGGVSLVLAGGGEVEIRPRG